MLNSRFDNLLIPYLEGSLDPHRRAQLEEAIANDPRLAREVEEMRRLKYQLERSAANFSAAASNRSAWPDVQARLQAQPTSYFKLSSFWGLGLTMGAAASLAVCFSIPHMAQLSPRAVTASNTPPILSSVASDNAHAVASILPSIEINLPSAPELSLVPITIGFANKPETTTRAAHVDISRPAILPEAPHSVNLGNMVQLASADIAPSVYVHPAVIGMATYNSAIVSPTTYVSNGLVQVAQAVSRPTGPVISDGVSNSPTTAEDKLSGSTAVTKSAPQLDEPSAVHLATMSTTMESPAPSNGDSPLMDTLRNVDDQADSDAANGYQARALARWQSVLQATSTSSIFGDDSAQLLSMQTLQEIQAAGLLSAMRQELEEWQEQDQNNIGVRRMLAALYSVQGEATLALDQRRKAAALSTAIGEDWFQLGQSEESAGNLNSANTDYNKSLQSGDLSNVMHANYARQRLPQSDS